jgi:hypothetical membrane protein
MSAKPDRVFYTGAILWIVSIQYYITQILVAAAWSPANPYSWAYHTISDLASTQCGPYGERLVCSPLAAFMNVSFILLGVTQALGAVLLWRSIGDNRITKAGLSGLVAAGLGTIVVGCFPENTISSLHIIGAALPFVFGNLGMVLVGAGAVKFPLPVRTFTMLAGLIGLAALTLFMTQTYRGLGIGGMERIVAYPQSIWMILFGLYLVFLQKSE